MKKALLPVNLLMLAAILASDICYMTFGGLAVKAVTSILFVLTGLINLTYCVRSKARLRFPVWMAAALTAAMLGDVLLGINFYLGTAVFALGHIFYFVSYCMLVPLNRRDLVCGIAIFAAALSIILLVPVLDFGGGLMQGVCGGYAFIISFMVGKAVSNLLGQRNVLYGILAAGSVLFFLSDLMLVLDRFGSLPYTGTLCLSTYYPAQFLLAFSILSFANTGRSGAKAAEAGETRQK